MMTIGIQGAVLGVVVVFSFSYLFPYVSMYV